MRTIPTTCVDCGAIGTMKTTNPAIVHKTVLCNDCQGQRAHDEEAAEEGAAHTPAENTGYTEEF